MRGRNRILALRGGVYQSQIWGGPYFDIAARKRVFKKNIFNYIESGLENPENCLLNLFQKGVDPVDCMTRTHFGSILPDDFLVKVDRASMYTGLEMRSPLLDARLIEFCFGSLASRHKVKGQNSRILQRKLGQRLLPASLNLERKQGFSIPINEWLRSEGVSKVMGRLEGVPDVFDMDEICNLVRNHMNGRQNGGRIFALIMLAISNRNLGL
jgi:asparagine synthase (glutamine-hydrolysing)